MKTSAAFSLMTLSVLVILTPTVSQAQDNSSTNELQNLAEVYAHDGATGNAVQLTAANGDIRFYNDDATPIEMLFLNESSGNVGIGTTTPGEQLEVEGNVLARRLLVKSNIVTTTSDLSFTANAHIETDDSMTFSVDSDNVSTSRYIGFGTNSAARDGNFSELMRIEESGNVGIGTTSPGEKLDVEGNVFAQRILVKTNAVTTTSDLSFSGNAHIETDASMTFSMDSDNTSSGGYIGFGTDSDARDGNFVELMRIKENGNVGIGTTAPAEKLDVAGNIKLSGNIVSDGDICIGSGC